MYTLVKKNAATATLDSLALQARAGDAATVEPFLVALSAHIDAALAHLAREPGFFAVSPSDWADLQHDVLLVLWQTDLARWQPAVASFVTFTRKRIRWMAAAQVRRGSRFVGEDKFEMQWLTDAHDPESRLADKHRAQQVDRLCTLVERELGPLAHALVTRVDLGGEQLQRVAKHKRMHVSRACRVKQKAHGVLAHALLMA